MQIHELNTFAGTPGAGNFLAIDNGSDTGKISGDALLKGPNDRIDNLITSVLPNSVETIATDSGGIMGTITLSKSVASFNFLDFYFKSVRGTHLGGIRIPVSHLPAKITVPFVEPGDNTLYEQEVSISASGTTMTVNTRLWEWSGSGADNAYVQSETYVVLLVRVDGINTSSNTNAELADVRVGADGITYASAGDAVRANDNRLYGFIEMLADEFGTRFNVNYSVTADKFISSAGYIGSSSGFVYSEPISVKAGDKICLTGSGYQTNVAMISRPISSTQFTPLVISSTGETYYEYIAPSDMDIIVSYNGDREHRLDIIAGTEAEIEDLKSDIDKAIDDIDELTDVTTIAVYTNIAEIGTLYDGKNAQLSANFEKVVLSPGSSAYKCIIIENLSGVEYLTAYCTRTGNHQYGCGIICADNDNYVIEAYYQNSGSQNETVSIKIPKGTKKIYVNGVNITPTAHSASRELIFRGITGEEFYPYSTIADEKSLTYINGYFIASNGAKVANNDFRYSESFYLKPCHLMIKAKGYLTNVAILSKGKTSDTSVSPLIISTDSTYKWYSADIVTEGWYLVCTGAYATTPAIVMALPKTYSDDSGNQALCDLSIFRNFGVVGDSYASGELYYGGSYHDKYFNSWGQVMARKHGTTCTNYSSGGLSTRSWLTAAKGLPLLLSSPAEDIYYLALGINDYYQEGESYLGSITDITGHSSYEDYGDTFYGNYGRIIEQIQNYAPHAKIVMFTVANTATLPQKFSDAIIEIADHYAIPYIVQADDDFFRSAVYTNMAGGHPTSIGYSGMAAAFERLLNRCIVDNLSYFFDLYMYD